MGDNSAETPQIMGAICAPPPQVMGAICAPPPQVMGAICAPPPHSDSVTTAADIPQPRQPSSLQGLLKFAMDATKTEDASHESHFLPLDEDRKKFLQQALSSMTIDVIEELMKHIRTLEHVELLEENEDDTRFTEALESIADSVCNIDNANDYYKIGGFIILQPCLKSRSANVRALACNLIAELCQNNPYCQKVVLENGFISMLINLVESETHNNVTVKALYAVSCIIRQNSVGCQQFIQYRGVQIFLETLRKNDEKCNTKICFLLLSLCESQPDFKSRLVFVGYIPVLFTLITKEPSLGQEHVLALLYKLLEDNASAISECKAAKNSYKDALEGYLEAVKDQDQFEEGREHCQLIHDLIFV